MKPIAIGQSGAAVEDVQARLQKLGCVIERSELETCTFGPSTRGAVRTFRSRYGLPHGDEVDDATWIELVDETYELGDRTLYLRLPYFRGQSIVGLMADGIAFQDTFDAIGRLRHVWSGKTTSAEFSEAHMALARAADVLEANRILIGATDPIARNVASRMWNVACATTEQANVVFVDLLDEKARPALRDADLVLVVATAPLGPTEPLAADVVNIVAEEPQVLTQSLAAALGAGAEGHPRYIRAELSALNRYDGSVTNRVVQNAAIMLLDAVCAVLGR